MWLVESSASALIVVLDGLHNILRLPQERKKKSSYDDLLQQRYQDSNLGMTESESVALPLGDSAICVAFFKRLMYNTKKGYVCQHGI